MRADRLPIVVTIGLAALVAVPAAAIAGRHGFDGLYGQDSFAYVDYALGPLRDALAALRPPPPFFWPPGYPLLVAGTSALTGLGDLSGLVVSLVAGALTPVLVALLARELLPDGPAVRARNLTALFAGLVAAVAGHLWQSSIVAMADTPAVALATLGAWSWVKYWRGGRWPFLALSAAAFGAAIETRWIYGVVALPFVAFTLARLAREARRSPREAVVAFVAAAVAGLLVLAPTWLPIGLAILNSEPAPFVGDFAVYRWDLAGAFSTTFDTPDGRLVYQLSTGLFYLLQPFQPYWLGPLALLVFPGLARVIRMRDAAAAAALLAWPGLVLLFSIGGAYQNTRFVLALLPPLAILAALGARWLVGVAHRFRGDRTRLAVRIALLGVVAALLVNALLAARFADGFAARMVEDRRAILSLADRVPSDARIVTLGPLAMLQHYGYPGLVDLNALDAEPMRVLLGDGRETFVLVDLEAIKRQWSDKGAGRALDAAEAERGLALVAAQGIWTLLRVGG